MILVIIELMKLSPVKQKQMLFCRYFHVFLFARDRLERIIKYFNDFGIIEKSAINMLILFQTKNPIISKINIIGFYLVLTTGVEPAHP